MSANSKTEGAGQGGVDSKQPEISFGSHYALQVALQTMKERCQQLQQRLITVEGENLSLRVQLDKTNIHCNKNAKQGEEDTVIEELHQQVAQLQRQKSQLTHHIFMVASENKQLWNRLSRLTQANKSLGHHLSRINDTLSQRSIKCKDSLDAEPDIKNCSGPTSKDDCDKNSLESGCKEESLEEISLKLIKSFRQEKIELEDQYAQMVEIQAGCPPLDLDFAAFETESQTTEAEDDTLLEEVQEIVDRLRSLQAALQEQRVQLRTSLSHLETIKNEGRLCPRCQGFGSTSNGKTTHAELLDVEMENSPTWAASTLPANQDIQRQLEVVAEPPTSDVATTSAPTFRRGSSPRRLSETSSQSSATNTPPVQCWMCPLCSNVYPRTVNFEMFQQHVIGHFPDDDPDPESIINNFEIIPKDLEAL